MLITKIKEFDEIKNFFEDNILIVKCFGCKEVYFPEEEIDDFLKEYKEKFPILRIDYLCREEFSKIYIEKNIDIIEKIEKIIIFSCGVGVQTFSGLLPYKKVYSGCDTFYLPGFQGVFSQSFDCKLCSKCWLNYTGCICPLTSCSKELLNGACGGAKNGKCEVEPEMDCGWIKIFERLKELNIEKILLTNKILIRDFSKSLKERS